MAIPTNYTSLKTEIANWLNRDDLVNDIETFIKFAESKINRVGRLSNDQVTAAIITTGGQDYTSVPSGFLEYISLIFDGNLYQNPVKVDISILDQYKDLISQGVPSHFAISNDQIIWNRAPDTVYNLTMRYWKKWNIAADSTNWILTNYPDAYLYGALAHAGEFINHPQTDKWDLRAKDALDQLEYMATKIRKSPLRTEFAGRGRKYNITQDY